MISRFFWSSLHVSLILDMNWRILWKAFFSRLLTYIISVSGIYNQFKFYLMWFHEFFATSISANLYNFRFRLNYRYIIGFCEALFDMLKLDDIGMTGITGIGFGLNDTRLIGCVTLVALGGKLPKIVEKCQIISQNGKRTPKTPDFVKKDGKWPL